MAHDEVALVDRLRAGDESAFATLVRSYHAPLLRFAETLVPSRAIAEEVVQDTWLGVVRGINRFEGRSSFKTWLYRILANRAKTTGVREHRTVPVEPAVATDRFTKDGTWATPPAPWTDDADNRLAAEQLAGRVKALLPQLAEAQRQVLVLHDIDGLSSTDVCDLIGLTEGNQRVLLHRARARMRDLLDREFEGA